MAVVTQEFPEAERIYGDLPGSPTHRGGDFPADEFRGRAREEDLVSGRVEQAADEGLPTRDKLDLVQEKRDRLRRRFRDDVQIGCGESGEVDSNNEARTQLVLLSSKIRRPSGIVFRKSSISPSDTYSATTCITDWTSWSFSSGFSQTPKPPAC